MKVLFIGAVPRSGSTILDLILGNVPGLFSTGELRDIWRRGIVRNQPCGCGAAFKECPFWSRVIERMQASGSLNIEEIERVKRHTERIRLSYRLIFHMENSGSYSGSFSAYTKTLMDLYHAIESESGSKVIVDSSKNPFYGLILNRIPGIELYFIHLVRDSRAVAHSMLRKKSIQPATSDKPVWMARKGPIASAFDWNLHNFFLGILGKLAVRHLQIRYEDLSTDPYTTLRKILHWLGEPEEHADFLKNRDIDFQVNHTVSGNPVRFRSGATQIRPDVEWHTVLGLESRIVTALTWPLLLAFDYDVMVRRG